MPFSSRLLLCLFALTLPLVAHAGEFQVRTNHLPPVKNVKDGLPSGIIGDVLMEIMADNGICFTPGDARLSTLSEAVQFAAETPNGIILGTMRTPERDKRLKWIGPIYTSTMGFLAAKERDIKINSAKDANQYRVGTIENSGSEKVAQRQGLDLNKAIRLTVNHEAIAQLVEGKIDLLVFPKSSAFYLMLEKNVNPNAYEMVLDLKAVELSIGFNRATEDAFIEKLEQSFKKIQNPNANGLSRYQEIVSKYYRPTL